VRSIPLQPSTARPAVQYIAAALGRFSGNVKAAAEALGLDRSTLYEKIKLYEIPR
jgi:DNA-binding NtrC family response regulator